MKFFICNDLHGDSSVLWGGGWVEVHRLYEWAARQEWDSDPMVKFINASQWSQWDQYVILMYARKKV